MLKIIILLLIAYFIYRSIKPRRVRQAPWDPAVDDTSAGQINDVMIQDPLCEAYFPRASGVHLKYGGEDLYFCSEECRDKFVASHPQRD